ncbi:PilX N-terminal domain-containing pilus assembly protein [Rhodanobacter sp. OK091]|uniref:pilus assembly PilX family protein n=1 Tax=Rhodanobacter sp. OK091 TaxID=1881037 RepID=UPI00091625E9|nr:PilX N-terminal domain-containing pilus assembly protein [Rhodanobacter sp. OK091]SHM06112.1 type IV pilus assembly protein PilX [Rhodanobacter sp. OK091]
MKAPTVSRPYRFRPLSPGARSQRGVALVVALLLLVVITLVGLAAVRGTIMQQKMASNLYDRQVAFQSAEAAIRAATALIPTNPGIIWHNCQAGGVTCLPNPFNDSTLPAGSIHTVATGTAVGGFTRSKVAASQPQYVVENMGNWVDQKTSTGFGQTANSRNYGVQGASGTTVYYRITARSGDPATVGDRAMVVLQAVVKQG